MAGNEVLEHRWGFLSSWCALLKKRISYTWPGREEEMWDLQKRQLSVSLPTHFDASDSEESEEDLFFFDEEDDDNFRRKFQNLREALALLSAVAHVDQSAWKYLLTTYCGLKFDNEDDEIPAQFQIYLNLEGRESLKWADTFDFDLVKICGTHQRKHPSRNYLNALKRIAFWDGIINGGGRMDLPGKDIYIPVRPYFGGLYIKSVDGPMEVMMDIWRAEEKIRIKWAKYNQKQPDQRIAPGQIRCTFVLEPVIADFNDNMLLPEMAETTEWLITNNQWFSQFSLWLQFDHERSADAYGKAKVFGRLMKAVFDSTLRSKEFEAMCSALVVNRTTKKLSMRLEMDAEDQTNSNQWWKWLAYGLFSKRARVCSSLETLSLMSICSLSEEDMSAFAAVLSSDHPEEELCGCPRGKMVEREATLKRDAPIRWQFNDRGQYRSGSELLRFATPVNFVRTFSDDGKSNWRKPKPTVAD
ncbi:hypothetical protein PHMEG_0005976 [Phytophthora megakarya]|uniref:Uncharacterized protein n=1 Tax=Phytophthora megakarya TaxID=4795 RepID=A0A225WPU5_9STRA|nr:hypothetical protein PHMEG_0005976 [Phytophthora megakarya]